MNDYYNNGNNSKVNNSNGAISGVSPEMLNFGLSAGQEMLNKQRDRWMPGVTSTWMSLKHYFAVKIDLPSFLLNHIIFPLKTHFL